METRDHGAEGAAASVLHEGDLEAFGRVTCERGQSIVIVTVVTNEDTERRPDAPFEGVEDANDVGSLVVDGDDEV
jgi:hypothetical protein